MAQQTRTKVKKKRRVSRFTTVCILFGMVVALILANVLVDVAVKGNGKPQTSEKKDSMFALKEITVSGDTRYLKEAIVQQSGLAVGQSIWSVDKVKAGERVLAAFPYIQDVKVTNTAYNKLNIAVSETDEIGVMYGGGKWLAVGSNGRILEVTAVESDRPLRALYLKGAEAVGTAVGEQAMDDRSFAIVTELLAAFGEYELDGVCEIDLSNKSDLRLNWNNRITVKLGNDSNLTHEIGVVKSALPGIERQYGEHAVGQLDVSSFSEDGTMAVFTPRDLLTTTTTATTTSPDGETTTTTTT
ncbi:MAG: FtsQ-type POTRA domain-containing protein [Ruminococcaceae bacterium]|nr:FtsQ-type POTRA domain-containing protein [Oscillospiraceae bacterium]